MASRTNPAISFALVLAAVLLCTPVVAQVRCNEGLEPLDRAAESRMSAMDFIREVAANETAFAKGFVNFGYVLDVSVQTLQGDAVDGEFRQVARVAHDAAGIRRKTVIEGPPSTLTRVKLTERDVDGLRDAFVLSPDILADRDIVYSGRQQLADFRAAVFDILPRSQQANPRAFTGRVWVRSRDEAIVRICGLVATGPFGPMRYEVVRTKVADQFWFPAQIRADEDTRVDTQTVRVRINVKYSDYAAR